MKKFHLLFYFVIGFCAPVIGQPADYLAMVSPKLREFLKESPKASRVFTKTLSEAFSSRTLQVYYFYSDDESIARASHYYPAESVVGILIRENQRPLDEFICLLFETINSTSQRHFQQVFKNVKSGEISKPDFVIEMDRTEFSAIKRTRDILNGIAVSKNEGKKSYFYQRFMQCPDGYDEFVAYSKKVASPHRNTTKEWEARYDLLRTQ